MGISSQEVREIFFSFFEGKSHLRVPPASLIPANDPTLFFVNSGMAPLKKFFVGEAAPPGPELCSIQPCVRTRLIGEVGNRHHLTFFEMLGNWSIDGYFKETAVELAYEILVERFGFPGERLYATVYKGNPALNIPPDFETARAWERVGLSGDRLVFLGDEIFWGPAGDYGPCGPSTDVFFDTGDARAEAPDAEPAPRVIQIWNAGNFMELDKRPDGTFGKLRFNSVDTGSALERVVTVANGFSTVYETDLLRPIFEDVGQRLGGKSMSEADRRVLTDHLRALTFILSEEVVPTNEGRGYIPRRLIRRCVAAVTRAGAHDFDFAGVIEGIVERSSKDYPSLARNRAGIVEKFVNEQKGFARVIRKGFDRLKRLCEKPPFTLTGADAFALSSSYGLPLELIRDFMRERGARFDEEGFRQEFRRHQTVSRAGRLRQKAAVKGVA
ncbi:MAG TPA: alanine--tRNA ligase-related protein [Pyrinomonadaceae bacterium]|nr:alanine--tRNA ligase-related protein [Pyrinomonadaceae bacterium]